ncbi:MAG: transcription antitermination factor NusB [Pseudomonadota bacterium]
MKPPTARALAAHLVFDVLANDRMLGPEHPALEDAEPQIRARALSLARRTLKHLPNLDLCLKPYLRRAPQPTVHAIMRIAVTELLIEETPAHAVVSEAVSTTSRVDGGKSATGLVNAVLRKVADEGPARLASLPPPRLPGWLRGRLQNAYGDPATRAMEALFAQDAPTDLTLKPGATPPEGTALPNGSLRLHGTPMISKLPGYTNGDFWVQDAAAACAVQTLGDVKGKRVLDLCAAPGGKTLQLAAAGANVTALDISEQRLTRLNENLQRTGLDAETICADALTWQPDTPFDAIVLDAPCSATGTLRRHPDLPYLRDGSAIRDLAKLQASLLARAATWLAPGGQLLYITCSLLPEEGEAHLADAPLPLKPIDPSPLGGDSTWQTPEGALRLRPDFWAEHGGMDGFFIALFQRPA